MTQPTACPKCGALASAFDCPEEACPRLTTEIPRGNTTAICRPPADSRGWKWHYVLELPGLMATVQTIDTWQPTARRWRRLGTPEQAGAIGWRYVRPALPDEKDDSYA